jgi:hypothetical protein
MIKLPTVFVLGAGASMPYGYPSGEGLLGDILTIQAEVAEVLKECGYGPAEWGPFQNAIQRSGHISIDAFLGSREDFRELGKLLIAANILRCETHGVLKGNKDDWYPMLLNRLDDRFEAIDFKDVSIVTFNYDRSLEHYFCEALCSRHNKQPAEVAKKLADLRVIHIYGHVGPLDWQCSGGRKYHRDITAPEVREAVKGIRIISEGRDDSEELCEARDLLTAADRVFFLGMAYHKENMRRLGFKTGFKYRGSVTGSGVGLTHQEREYLRDQYGFSLVGGDHEPSAVFLRNNKDFLRLDDN